MISIHILLIIFLNEPELIFLHSWMGSFILSNAIDSIYS